MKLSSFVLGAAAGAAAAWFLDPNDGARRRNLARDRGMKYARQGAAEAQTKAQQAAGQAQSAVQQAKPSGGEADDPAERLGDAGLRDKVESEIFRGVDVDKGKVLVSVEDAIVYLRGELESREQAERLAQAAREIEGVRAVEDMLHEPGEPAPMQQEPGVTG